MSIYIKHLDQCLVLSQGCPSVHDTVGNPVAMLRLRNQKDLSSNPSFASCYLCYLGLVLYLYLLDF